MPRRALFGEYNANGATGVTALGFYQEKGSGKIPKMGRSTAIRATIECSSLADSITLNTWVVCEVDTFYHLPHNLTFTGSHIL
jgi:hypothetical protein